MQFKKNMVITIPGELLSAPLSKPKVKEFMKYLKKWLEEEK